MNATATRIDPLYKGGVDGEDARKGLCGATPNTIAARNFIRNGGMWDLEIDPVKHAHKMIAHIDQKRQALGDRLKARADHGGYGHAPGFGIGLDHR